MQELNDAMTALRHWLEVLQLCGIDAAIELVSVDDRVLLWWLLIADTLAEIIDDAGT